MVFVAGLATLGAAAYLGSGVWGQQPNYSPTAVAQPANPVQPQRTPVQTRIAVVNMLQVVKSYKKCQTCEDYVKNLYMQGEQQLNAKKKVLEGLKAEVENPNTTPQRREQLEKDWRKVQREMEEIGEEFKTKGAKMRGDLLVGIYREVEEAVSAYAKANGIELVMHYNDASPSAPADYYSPMNVQRKMSAGACMPMYITPGMDISGAVVDMLNRRLASAPTGAAPAAGN
jgi:Skp family chaperone for outer membrane proteins